ncbi:MAG: ArsR family transcriptional regulator [Comamonadaceae bacterium]|nr:MAG: ArsR family transcriptional regulator [Comamonadaceae bacterium]
MVGTVKSAAKDTTGSQDEGAAAPDQGRVFELAAELFAVLATPMRLRILSALCVREKTVSELLGEIDTTQPNLSQHLAVLHRTGVLAKRKDGTQVIYRVQSDKAVALCRSVCTQIAIELDEPDAVSPGEALLPPGGGKRVSPVAARA